MLLGKVRSFKDTWGFLRSDAVPGDIFVGLRENPHLGPAGGLSEGTAVLFDVRKDVRGKNEAVNVQPLIQVNETPAVGTTATRHTGWVRSFTGSWGFINSASFAGDLFVGLRNNPQLSAALAAGDQVEFAVRQIDGKSEAIDVHVLGGQVPTTTAVARPDGALEKGAQVKHLVGEYLQGTVRSFRDSWGFVVSEDNFQGDLYLHRRNNPELGPVQAGDPVTFQVSEDQPGHFHAVGTRVVPVQLSNLVGHRLFGWVKSFYPEEWGFLGSLRFEEELFVSLEKNPQLKTALKVNEGVTFIVQKDQALGQLHAVEVSRSNTTVSVPGGGADGPRSPKDMIGQRCTGKVKSFRDDWGFVVSDSFEGDLFLHLGDNPGLPALAPGEEVEFTISRKQDKLNAENVQRLRPRGASRAPLSDLMGQVCTGTVRSFSGEWGFITTPHFEGDIFVGLRSNRHLMVPLVPGDIVEFQLTRDASKERETFEAANVRVLSPAAPAATPQVDMAAWAAQAAQQNLLSQLQLHQLGLGLGQLGAFGLPGLAVPGLPLVTGARSRSPRRKSQLDVAPLLGQRLTGTIRSFRGDWGFVTSDAFPGDLFVGTRANRHLETPLKEGDMISFMVEVGGGGKPEAVNVEMI